MKRYIKIISMLVLLISMFSFTYQINITNNIVKADTEIQTKIEGHALALEKSVYLVYYASKTNVPANAEYGVLVWDSYQDSYTYGKETYKLDYIKTETINSIEQDVYYLDELSACDYTMDLYAVAYIKYNDGNEDQIVYSSVDKYSILQYAYNKLGKTGTAGSSALQAMLKEMLEYGAAAQVLFEDNYPLATSEFYQIKVVNGTLPDHCTHGLYVKGSEVSINADDKTGYNFVNWTDSSNNVVSTGKTLQLLVGTSNETFTAHYSCLHFNYDISVTNPTCTEQGYTTYTCSSCGYQYVSDYVDALGHDWKEVSRVSSTCTEQGSVHYVCSHDASHTKDETLPLASHNYNEEVIAPTCQTEGYTKHTCLVCGDTYNDHIVECCDHSYTNAECIWCHTKKYNLEITFDNFSGTLESSFNSTNTENSSKGTLKIKSLDTRSLQIKFDYLDMSYQNDNCSVKFYDASLGDYDYTTVANGLLIMEENDYLIIEFTRSSSGDYTGGITVNINAIKVYDNPVNLTITEQYGTLNSDVTLPSTVTINSETNSETVNVNWITSNVSTTTTGALRAGTYRIFAEERYNGDLIFMDLEVLPIQLSLINNDTEYEVINCYGNSASYGKDIIVKIPSTFNGKNITSIKANAFENCFDLVSVEIPDSVTSIGSLAFNGCTKLASVKLSSNITILNDHLFYRCKALTSVTIPDNVTTIGQFAFAYSGITSINITKNISSIVDHAFSGCNDLTVITVDANNETYYTTDGCNAVVKKDSNMIVVGCKTTVIPNYVIAIESYAFSYYTSMTSLYIPSNVDWIYAKAFEGCTNLVLSCKDTERQSNWVDNWDTSIKEINWGA